jgi:hypothetical protein
MVRIAISQAAFDAIAATLALGSVGCENAVDEQGRRLIWLPPDVLNRLRAMRGMGESYSDVILRVAKGDGGEERSCGPAGVVDSEPPRRRPSDPGPNERLFKGLGGAPVYLLTGRSYPCSSAATAFRMPPEQAQANATKRAARKPPHDEGHPACKQKAPARGAYVSSRGE